MKVETRQKIERQIARRAAKDLIAAGYKVAVFDGEEIALEASTDVRAIIAAMFSTDEDYLFAMTPGEDGKLKRAGWVRFIYGNTGFDVINDYTTNLETVLAGTNALADHNLPARGRDDAPPAEPRRTAGRPLRRRGVRAPVRQLPQQPRSHPRAGDRRCVQRRR